MKKIVKPSYSVQEYEMEKAQTFEKSGHEVGSTSLQAAVALQKVFRVAALLLHKSPRYTLGPPHAPAVLPANQRILMVGDSGFEPLTSSASRKRSPPELIALT